MTPSMVLQSELSGQAI